MVDATLRSIYSAADETIAQLDQLHAANQSRRSLNLQRLEHLVAGLGTPSGGDDPVADPAERRERFEDRRASSPPDLPFVALPQRTTHGGPFGPKVREKLIAEALGRDGW
jgi:hypothetical protein